ncbi:MAG: XRE family transcriptional regulator [Desulfovibrionales bacterium]|nr:MAG: XRE family transcriptional regulator [Desulfovibrionales bacterium]
MSKKNVGARICSLREEQELSLEQLAERSGLEPDFIARMEASQDPPSLGPLVKVARGLGVRLGTFLDDHVSRDPLIVRFAERQAGLNMHRNQDSPVALRFFPLGVGKTDRHMEPFFIQVLPESARDKHLSSHEGEEFIVVVSGEIEIRYGQETYRLQPGDSVYYNSAVPHHVGAVGGDVAQIYAVLYIPE